MTTYLDMNERVAAILRSASQVAGCYIDASIGYEEDALIERGLIYRDASDDFFIEQAGVDLLAQWDLGLELLVQYEALHGSPADASKNTPTSAPPVAEVGATGSAGLDSSPVIEPGRPTFGERRATAIGVLTYVAAYIPADMDATLEIGAVDQRVNVHINSDDPEDGRRLARSLGLIAGDPRPGDRHTHYLWSGSQRGIPIRVVVLAPIDDLRAQKRDELAHEDVS
jgi:hypothetical protein